MLIEGVTPRGPMTGSSSLVELLRTKGAKKSDTGELYPDLRPTPAERAERIAGIKNRISKGYYNTESVLEDLSDSFAGVFDKLT